MRNSKEKKNGMIDNQWVVYIDKSLSWDRKKRTDVLFIVWFTYSWRCFFMLTNLK
jgi:hypothetical protein